MNFSQIITDTYDIVGEIGKGGGGTVYEAYHKRLQKKVVLKKQHESIRGLVNERTETDTLKNLRHSNLPQVLDFIVTDNAVFTVMDYIPGKSVKEILDKEGKLNEGTVIKYAKQLCDALCYLHNSNPPIIHGDIKPDNIMVTPEGDICLIDFNISSALGAASSYAFGYTLGYAAPEQKKAYEIMKEHIINVSGTGSQDETLILGEEQKTEIITDGIKKIIPDTMPEILFDKRADIYSYGATLYHMLTGIRPSASHPNIKPVIDIYPKMNRGLADIITKSMNPDPKYRFQNFGEIKKVLDNIYKYDLTYKAKLLRRSVVTIGLAVIIGATSAGLLLYIKHKSEDNYRVNLEEATDLYYSLRYEDSINYVDTQLLKKKYFDLDDDLIASAYYLRGNNWMGIGQFDNAVYDYETSLEFNAEDYQVYRDLAIAWARKGDIDKASETISKAQEIGIENEDILLAEAEIAIAKNEPQEALLLCKQCLDNANDIKTKERACYVYAKSVDTSSELELKDAILILQKGIDLNGELKVSMLELLAQRYIDLSVLQKSDTGYNEALGVFEQIVDNGWDTYTTHNNMAILYEKSEDLESAEKELQIMLDRFPENYNTYKRLAFLEIDKQNSNEFENRNYDLFIEYYEKALELYNKQGRVSDDMEMNVLGELWNQLN